MIAHRSLSAIVRRVGWSQALLDKIRRMFEDRLQSPAAKVIKLFPAQAKTASKRRLTQGSKDFIQISHRALSSSQHQTHSRFKQDGQEERRDEGRIRKAAVFYSSLIPPPSSLLLSISVN